MLRPAFNMALKDEMIISNPFSFELADALINDTVKREALSRENERKFLAFVRDDEHFSKYYDAIYVLFKTGMRISEFCGLTISDIDFNEKVINIDLKGNEMGMLIGKRGQTLDSLQYLNHILS